MLMMVDPNVHFHVFPRYEGARTMEGVTVDDRAWPGPPDLKSAIALPADSFSRICRRLMQNWLIIY